MKRNTTGIQHHQFKKGRTGNPNGRPRKLPALDQLVAEVMGVGANGQSEAKKIIQKLSQLAKKGNIRAAEILLDRAYGKPKQQMDLTNNGESFGPIKVTLNLGHDDPQTLKL